MWQPAAVAPALETSQVEARAVRQAKDLAVADSRPTVFLLDAESRSAFPVDLMRAFVDAGGAIVALGRNGETDVPEGLRGGGGRSRRLRRRRLFGSHGPLHDTALAAYFGMRLNACQLGLRRPDAV